MKKIVMLVVVVIVAYGVYAGTKKSFSDEAVAILDGNNITVSDLSNYVNNLLGDKYAKLLESKDGLRQLADYYITRQILLQEAKKNIKSDNSLVSGHLPKGSNEDTMLLTALLDREVNKKIAVRDGEVAAFMLENNISDETSAVARLESVKRNELFKSYKEELLKNHNIKIY